MDNLRIKISDIFYNDFNDFVAFCHSMDKYYSDELNAIDFVAYKSKYGLSREVINQIKQRIANYTASAPSETVKHNADPSLLEPIQINPESGKINEIISSEKNQQVEEAFLNSETDGKNDAPSVKKATPLSDDALETDVFQKKNPKQSLELVFQVDANAYDTVPIEKLGLSVRPIGCLKNLKCVFLSDVLHLSQEELSSTKNLGIKSYNEILSKIDVYLKEHSLNDQKQRSFVSEAHKTVLNAYITFRENRSSEKLDLLTEAQKNYVKKLVDLEEKLDSECVLQFAKNPEYALILSRCFNNYIYASENKEKILSQIPSIFLDGEYSKLKISHFLWAYNNSNNNIKLYIDEDFLFENIYYGLSSVFDYKWNYFFEWLHFDVENSFTALLESFNDDLKNIVFCRAHGMTLEMVAQKFGVTRERIRQIESRALRKFISALQSTTHDPFLLIYALRDGDAYLTKGEIKEYISDELVIDIIWYFLGLYQSDGKQSAYSYSKKYDGIIFNLPNTPNVYSQIDDWLAEIGDYISKTELETEKKRFSQQSGIAIDLIEKSTQGLFFNYKTVLCRHKISVIEICDYILKTFYPLGFKTADENDYLSFCKHVSDVFGDNVTNMTQRAVDAKMGQVGVLCDRGKYIHPSYLNVSKALIDDVITYVTNSQRKTFTFSELFSAFAEKFYGTSINNYYALQGALGYYGCPYKMTKDYILKEEDYSFTDEVESFVEKRGIVHKSEIFDEFASLTEAKLSLVVNRIKNVISMGNGNYMHASTLVINQEEYDKVRNYLTQEVANMPANIRKVMDDIGIICPDLLNRNQINDSFLLLNVLNYMFWNEFSVSFPYIGKLGEQNMTNAGMMLRLIDGADRFNLFDLLNMYNSQMYTSISPSYIIGCLAPTYIRVDDTDLMKLSLTGITEPVIEKVVELVEEQMNFDGYLPAIKITDFMWYPEILIPWNPQLVVSIISISQKIKMLYFSTSYPCIFISDKYGSCNTYQDFLVALVDEALENGCFTTKLEMREWLVEKKLITDELPNYLGSTEYYLYDEDGSIKKKSIE